MVLLLARQPRDRAIAERIIAKLRRRGKHATRSRALENTPDLIP